MSSCCYHGYDESPDWAKRFPVGPVRFRVRCGCGYIIDDLRIENLRDAQITMLQHCIDDIRRGVNELQALTNAYIAKLAAQVCTHGDGI